MDLSWLFGTFTIAYFLGSIPFGLLITRVFNVGDIRSIGSGNIGATNVLRTGNKTAAALTLLCDAGKGAVAVLLARSFANEDATQLAALMALVRYINTAERNLREQEARIDYVEVAQPRVNGQKKKNGHVHEEAAETAATTVSMQEGA